MPTGVSYKRDAGDSAERLLNLTLALLSAPHGLTKAELFSAIRDYRNSLQSGTAIESLERKFERDKTMLRENGVQVETFIPPSEMGDNQESRYLISAAGFAWPKGLKLSSKQLQILNLAAQVWRQASLSVEANRGLNRLRALGSSVADSDIIGFAPRIKTHEPAFMPLSVAISDAVQVEFEYRKPSENSATRRIVDPWLLHNISGQWLLVAFDHERGDVRNFLLRRITSKVNALEQNFSRPKATQLEAAKSDLEEHISRQVAILRVRRDSIAWFQYQLDTPGALNSDGLFELNYMDLHLLAEELRTFGTDVEVLKPAELAAEIRLGLEKVLADHA